MTQAGPSSFLQVHYLPDIVGIWFAVPQVEGAHWSGRDGEETAGIGETGFTPYLQ